MNKIIESNRTDIFKASMNIIQYFAALADLNVKMGQAIQELNREGSDYSNVYISRKLQEITAAYGEKAAAYEPKLTAEINRIEADGHEMENALDITDADLQAALQIITALNGQLDYETSNLIFNTLKGNQKALIILRGAYERYSVSTGELDKHIFEIEKKTAPMWASIYSIVSDTKTCVSTIWYFRKGLMSLCQLIGVDVKEEQFSLGNISDDTFDNAFRMAAGLPSA